MSEWRVDVATPFLFVHLIAPVAYICIHMPLYPSYNPTLSESSRLVAVVCSERRVGFVFVSVVILLENHSHTLFPILEDLHVNSLQVRITASIKSKMCKVPRPEMRRVWRSRKFWPYLSFI